MVDKISMMNRARLQKRNNRDKFVKKLAIEEFRRNKQRPLFLSGILLYWAEGTRIDDRRRKYQLAFTNSDPNLVNFYCRFLREYFKDIDRKDWRAELFLYPDINPEQAVSYWSDILRIPCQQFIKPQILNGGTKSHKKLQFGTCRIYVNGKDACITMQDWIEEVIDMMRR